MAENMRAKFSARGRPLRCIAVARRLMRREDGSAAVEFGLVAVPFLALVFAIIETAFVFFAGQTLETAAADSARLIMTGQQQTASVPTGSSAAAEFIKQVCNPANPDAKIKAIFDCTKLVIDVRAFSSFSNINVPSPVDANGNFPVDANGNLITNPSYQPGGPGDIVVVRMMYQWPVFVSLLGLNGLSNMSGNSRLLMSTVAFRNEPYQ